MILNGTLIVKGRARIEKDPWQEGVLDRQVDATLDPGASPATGARYIIENSAALHANFGTITGVGDDDIVEYTGTAFEVVWDASVNGEGAMCWVEDENKWFEFNGTAWSQLAATVTVGDGLDGDGSSGSPLTLDLLASGGLKIVAGELSIEPADFAGTGLEDDGSDNLQIADSGVTTAKIANDAVDTDKLDYTSTALRASVVTWLNADGATKTISHNFASDVMVEIVDTDTKDTVFVDEVERTDNNTLTLKATVAPPTSYTVYVREVATKA